MTYKSVPDFFISTVVLAGTDEGDESVASDGGTFADDVSRCREWTPRIDRHIVLDVRMTLFSFDRLASLWWTVLPESRPDKFLT